MDKARQSVLIIDDQHVNIIELSKALRPDYKIYAAGNGRDAIVAAEENLPNVILLDIQMADMDGYEIIASLKKSPRTKDIPVIFITGLAGMENEEKGLALGAVDYISKPFSLAIVKLRVQNQMKMQEQMRTIERQMDEIRSLEYENIINMLNSTPHSCHLWNRNMKMLDCNGASLELFKFKNKNEFIRNYHILSPEFQPDGQISSKKAMDHLKNVFAKGKEVYEWVHQTSEGDPIPCEITLVRIKLQNDDFAVAYIKDLREHISMKAEIITQDTLLHTVSSVAGTLLQSSMELFMEDLRACMGMLAAAVGADRVYIWKNYTQGGELYCAQIDEWSGESGPDGRRGSSTELSYGAIPEVLENLSRGDCINGIVREMTEASRARFTPQGILSIFVAPIFLNEQFWGFIGFDDCQRERIFTDNEERILRSAGLLIANALLKNEMTMELKESAKKLESALGEAQEANKAKSAFLSNMSHEIRTPMNAITGMGELLLHERLEKHQMEYVNDIVVSAKSLLGIINDILDFSKIESGKLELNPIDYDFYAFIEQLESMFVYVAQKKGLEFRLTRGSGLPGVLFGDDMRLRQALTNIIGNAVKFTECGYVQLDVMASGGSLQFAVRDTGIGIRKEDQPKLFKAFEQVDKSINRKVVGTGLGLIISKSFVEMMGGAISLESEYGKGTTFRVTIPAVAGNKEKIEAAKETEERTVYAPEAKILIVDDNNFNLRVAGGLMSLMGVDAMTADSGQKAIEMIKEREFDVVFMDHMMPDMDGVETTAEIRRLGGRFSSVPIVALTANAVQGAREMFLSNGFSDFLSKPIDTSELIRVFETWLPPGRIMEQTARCDARVKAGRESELRDKSIAIFVKENRGTFERIMGSLSANDIKTAHRIAHTLKSGAGYLGKKGLQEAAFSLELSLQAQPPAYKPEQLDALGRELAAALLEFEPVAMRVEREKPGAVQADGTEIEALLTEIRPLLEKGDFGASEYVAKLQSIEGMDRLADLIDDYEFEAALDELEKLA